MPRAELEVQLAGDLRAARSLSPTSALAWRQCEFKYALSYLYGWREPSTLPQLIGNVVHRSVELLYGLEPDERTREAAAGLLTVALAEELARPTYEQLTNLGDPSPEVTEAGVDALDGVFELEEPRFVSVGADGLEVWVEAQLYGAPMRGRIDRIYDASGAEVVADYKTGKVPHPRFTEKAFFGLWTYAAALAARDPEHRLADRVELLYLIGRERLSRPVLRAVALEHAKELARIWRQIEVAQASHRAVARRSRLCDWCAFKPACPIFQSVPPTGTASHDALLLEHGLSRAATLEVAHDLERRASEEEEGDEP